MHEKVRQMPDLCYLIMRGVKFMDLLQLRGERFVEMREIPILCGLIVCYDPRKKMGISQVSAFIIAKRKNASPVHNLMY